MKSLGCVIYVGKNINLNLFGGRLPIINLNDPESVKDDDMDEDDSLTVEDNNVISMIPYEYNPVTGLAKYRFNRPLDVTNPLISLVPLDDMILE